MKPKVSVIIPVKNAQEFLNMTIDSLLNQSLEEIELFIVDYGSSDHTESVVSFYKDPRVSYIGGGSSASEALEAGLNKAQAPFIALSDQQSISIQKRLEQQLNCLSKHPGVDLVSANFEIIDTDSRPYPTTTEKIDHWTSNPFTWGNVMFRADLAASKKVRLFNWWGDPGFRACLLPDKLYSLRLSELAKDDSDTAFYVWLALAANHSMTDAPSYGLPTKDFEVRNCINSLNKVWSKLEMTSTQKVVLSKKSLELQKQLNALVAGSPPPLISVVMSVYNGQKHLREAVESILNQTFYDFEFLIVNDGSTDQSARILSSFDDPRIRIINQTNHGLVASLNTAISLARGEFIARMDADDVSDPTRLEEEFSVMMSNPRLGVVGSFWTYIDGRGHKSITLTTPTKDFDLKRRLYTDNCFAHGSTLIRKVALEKAGGYRSDYGPAEDFDLWRRLAEAWQFYQIPKPLYLYRISDTSISSVQSGEQAHYAAMIMREQWHKPLLLKSRKAFRADAQYYKRLDSPYKDSIYRNYLEQQRLIVLNLFGLGAFKSGLNEMLALVREDKKYLKPLSRSALGGFLRRLGLKEKRL